SRRVLRLGRVLADLDESAIGLILNDIVDTPGALAGRDGVVLEPLADRVVEEVLARTHRGVDELIEIVVGGDLLGRLGRRAAGEPRQREKKEDRASHSRGFQGWTTGGPDHGM